jgi:hypothetical protein
MIAKLFLGFGFYLMLLGAQNGANEGEFYTKKNNWMTDNDLSLSDLKLELKILDKREIWLKITNLSPKMIRAYSHIIGEEKHYDYFEIEAITPDYDQLYFSLSDERLKSAPVIVELQTNESFEHTIDLLTWANRPVNRATLQRAGLNHLTDLKSLKIRAKYRNSPCQNCNEYYQSIWTGFVYSEWKNYK